MSDSYSFPDSSEVTYPSKNKTPLVSRLLTPEQAAELLGVSLFDLEDWATRRVGPTFYIFPLGARYPEPELLEFRDYLRVRPLVA
jgi:hypothetical protein